MKKLILITSLLCALIALPVVLDFMKAEASTQTILPADMCKRIFVLHPTTVTIGATTVVSGNLNTFFAEPTGEACFIVTDITVTADYDCTGSCDNLFFEWFDSSVGAPIAVHSQRITPQHLTVSDHFNTGIPIDALASLSVAVSASTTFTTAQVSVTGFYIP